MASTPSGLKDIKDLKIGVCYKKKNCIEAFLLFLNLLQTVSAVSTLSLKESFHFNIFREEIY